MDDIENEEKPLLPFPQFMRDGEIMPPQPDSERMPAMYSPGELALWLGIGAGMLAKARKDGTGPPFVLIGTRVLYPEDQLLAWARATRRTVEEMPRRQRGVKEEKMLPEHRQHQPIK